MFRRNLIALCAALYLVVFASFAHAQLPQISSGLSYLSTSQNPDGTWGNTASINDTTAITVASIDTLKTLNQTAGSAYTNATAWLQGQSPNTVGYIAERTRALNITDYSINAILPSIDPANGAWGGDEGFVANNLDTPLALQALKSSNYNDLSVSNNALAYLLNTQNSDGGWGFDSDDDSKIYLTAIVSATLQQFPQTTAIANAITKASSYLVSHQNSDNGFGVTASGVSSSTVYETALAYIALVGDGQTQGLPLQKALTYLTSSQSVNGSWNEDPYSTALALKALYLTENKPASSPPALTTGGVMGIVVDGTSNTPLTGVTARLVENPAINAISDVYGTFVLSGIAVGGQQITLSMAGYATQTITATFAAGDFINVGKVGILAAPATGTVQGVVWDSEVNAPYSHVTVRVVSGSNTYEAYSGLDGSYKITDVLPGTVTVSTPDGPKPGYFNIQIIDTLLPGGVLVFNPHMSKTRSTDSNVYVRTDKALYNTVESVAVKVSIQNNRIYDYPATLKLHVTDSTGASLYDANVDIILAPSAMQMQNASFTLPVTAHGGTCTVLAEVYNAGGTKIGTSSSNFELWVIPIAVTPSIPAQLAQGTNTITFDLTNNRSIAVSAGALVMTVTDPDGQVITSTSQPFSLAVGEMQTLSYALTFSSLKFGTYTLTYTQTDEITNGQTGTVSLPNSVDISTQFNKFSYKKTETANLQIGLNNTGRFNLDGVAVNVAVPDAGYADTRNLTIGSGSTQTQQNAILLPETITTGEHASSVTLTLAGGSSITKNIPCLVSQTILGVTPNDGSENIPVRTSILVHLTESVDASSITSGMVSLTANGVESPGSVRLTADGASLIFKPQSKLSYATTYIFTIKASVRDLVGKSTVIDLTTTFSTPLLDPYLVGYWPMDGDWKDYSINGNNGTAYGSSSFTDGRVSGVSSANFVIDSLYFEGSGGYVPTAPQFVDGVADTFTLSFWAKPTATRETTPETTGGVSGEGVQRFAIAPVNMYNLGYLGATAGVSVGTNGISVFEETTNVSGAVSIGYMPSLLVYDAPTALSGWNHIAVVYNNKQPSLYLNGVFIKTGQTSQQFEVYPSAVFAFGAERATGAYGGQLEGVVYHKRALTALEIQTLYQKQNQSVPQISITSPGQSVKYNPGETGSATVSVTASAGVTRLYCSASGAATEGGLAINFEQPQLQTTQQLTFHVANNAAPYAPILLSCVAQTPEGFISVGEYQLQTADLVPPTIVSSSPVKNAIDVSATMPIVINFSEPIDPASIISHDTFKFQRTDNGAWVSCMYRLSTDSTAMQILPSPALDSVTPYTMTFSRIRDLAGNVMVNDYALQFTTLQQTSLTVQDQGSSSMPYALPSGRYGTLVLNNSYVSVSGGVTADSITMDNSTLTVSPATFASGDLSVVYGDMQVTNGSQVNVTGALNLAAHLNLTNSTMAVTGPGIASGNVALTNSTLTLKNPLQITGNVTLLNNSVLTHYAATSTDTSKLDVTAANMTIDATSKIDATGKGYLGGYPDSGTTAPGYTVGNTTSGGSGNTNGGSYGGLGGLQNNSYAVNAVYGDVANPNDLGSGGGGYYYDLFTGLNNVITKFQGGSGGGLVRLNIATLSLDGSIMADGADSKSAGGSGGGILIQASNIYGSGSISANGGSGGAGITEASAGGGGGRIAVYYDSLTVPVTNITATGGLGKPDTAAANGSAGTIFLKNNAVIKPALIISNGTNSSSNVTNVPGGDYGFVSVSNGAHIIVSGDISSDQNVVFTGSNMTIKGGITSSGNLTFDGSNVVVSGTVNVPGSLILKNGAVLSHSAATTTASYKLDVSAGALEVDATSKIDVSGKGYLAGYQGSNSSSNTGRTNGNVTTGGSVGYSGGSYGGPGGRNADAVGASYGSLLLPDELGSGGGGAIVPFYGGLCPGGTGGGLVKINAGSMLLNGNVFADGANVSSDPNCGGAGSGGGILINVGALSGVGMLSAKGGSFTPSTYTGSGGGGRIAVYYSTNTLPTANITASGGKSGNGTNTATNGGSGTIYLKDSAKASGDVIVNNGGVATSNVTSLAGGDYGLVSLTGGAKTSIAGDISSDRDVLFTGSNLTFNGGITTSGNLTLDGSTITVVGTVNVAGALTLKNGSVLSHSAATTTTANKLEVTAGTIDVDITSKIDVTGKGYLGGYQGDNNGSIGRTNGNVTTGGSSDQNGGSYGGLGGYSNRGSVSVSYGSQLLPNELGSGGGGVNVTYCGLSPGGNGGGLVKLTAGSLLLNGSILADGANILDIYCNYGAAGSGGGILINVGDLSGTGTISARGGSITPDTGSGSGGGGRIAIYYTTNTLPTTNITASGGKSANGTNPVSNGGAGTIYLKDSAKTTGDVIVSNGGVTTSNVTTVAGGNYGQVNTAGGTKINIAGDISFDQDVILAGNTMTFNGGITIPGSLTIDGSIITVFGTVNVTGALTLKNGSVLSHSAATTTTAYKLDISALTIEIDSTSKIDVTGKGYLGGYQGDNNGSNGRTNGNVTTGGSSDQNGGSYGGLGGYSNRGSVSEFYGSQLLPNELGSGGGGINVVYCGQIPGGNGGGLVKLTAGSILLNGSILADGANILDIYCNYGAAGSGGGILISTGALSGTGMISAKGGSVTPDTGSGSGGGGRIAVYYTTNTLPTANITASGGKSANGTNPVTNGGAGTIYLKDSAKTTGDVIVSNGGVTTSNITSVAGGNYGQISTTDGAKTGVAGDISFDQDVVLTGNTMTFNGGITTPGNFTLDGSTITANGPVNITGALTLKNSSVLNHSAATITATYKLDVTAGTVEIDTTSRIDVRELGYLGGFRGDNNGSIGRTNGNVTTGGSSDQNGGSYGGLGGYSNRGNVGVSYGSQLLPNELGSGGGGVNVTYCGLSPGGNGGGLVKLTAGGILLNGSILADGANILDLYCNYGAAGSGGGILINVGDLSGTGTISARGGSITPDTGSGSGGGGRIAIYYNSNSLPFDNIVASGGKSGNGSNAVTNGGDGTVYLFQYVMPVTVTKSGAGTGTVQSTPTGISCGTTCSDNFPKTSGVTLTAIPDSGMSFNGWSGACSGTGSCTVTMDAAKAVTAAFSVIPPPTVSISSPVAITKNNRPLLQYSVSAGTVVVKVDNVVVSKVTGNTLDLLSDGTHIIRVEATNNGATGYAESVVTIDTIAPVLTVTALPAIVKVATQTLIGTIEAGSNLSIAVTTGTASLGTVTYPTATTWQCVVSNLMVGANAFTITAFDQAENSSQVVTSVTYALPVSLVLSQQTVAADFNGTVVLTVNNVDPSGSEVLVEQFVDANGNGAIDSGDYPVSIYKVTDGISAPYPHISGDEDAVVNGVMVTTLNYALTSDIIHAPGSYLFRVTSGSDSATAPFTVSPVAQLQFVSGAVTDGTNPVSGAIIRLLNKWQQPVTSTIADSSGNYTLEVPAPGDYRIIPVSYGFAADPAGSPVTLTTGQNLTSYALTLTPGTIHLTGTVKKDQTSIPVSGVWIKAVNGNNSGYAITAADGSYDLKLPSGLYDVSVVADATLPNPATKGYLATTQHPLSVNLQTDTTNFNITLNPVTVTATGTVVDQFGTPLSGLPVTGKLAATSDAREPAAFATTDSSGNYALNLSAGTEWTISLDDSIARHLGYIGSRISNFSTAGTLTGNNLTAHPVTSWIQGTVRDSNANLLGNIDVQIRNADTSIVTHLRTAADGSYRFGVFSGSWFVNAFFEHNGTRSVGEQAATVTNGQTDTKDFVVDVIPPVVTITSPTASTTPDNTPLLAYAVNEGIVVVKVDGVAVNKSSGDSLDTLLNGSHTVVVESTDVAGNVNSSSVTFTVNYTPLVLSTAVPADGTLDIAYNQTLSVTGGVSPYNFSLINSTTLPTGLTLNSSTGVISGTPAIAGSSTFQIQVADSDGAVATQQYTLVVYSQVQVTTVSLSDGYLTVSYNQTLTASGGKMPYTWSVISGSLPSGLTLNTNTGVVSGIPTGTGSSFTVQVCDANTVPATKNQNIAVYALPSITTTSLPSGTTGTLYSQPLAVSGGKTPFVWSVSVGTLPAGLSLNPSTGVISGTPTTAGTSNFTILATDANNKISSKALSIIINSTALAITTTALPDGYLTTSYNTSLAATGGVPPYTWSITSGTLPTGLSLNSSTGAITGIPTATGSKTMTFQIKDLVNTTATKSLSITVYSLPSITTTSLASGTTGTAYSQTLAATGGKTAYTWSVTSGTLPAGLSLNVSTGAITGTPTVSGTSSITFQVADANGKTASKALSITIASVVAALDSWTNLSATSPNNSSATNVAVGSTFTVGSGSNRLLLVSIAMEIGTAANPTISAAYGGTTLTQLKVTANTRREIVWVGYLKESQIGSGAKQLTITYSGATGNVSALHVNWASYTGVNQTTPAVSSAAVNTGSASTTFGSSINYVLNGMTVVVASNGGTPAVGALSATPAFTAGTATTSSAQTSRTFVTAKHTATGSYASSTSVTWTGTTSLWSGLVVLSLQP